MLSIVRQQVLQTLALLVLSASTLSFTPEAPAASVSVSVLNEMGFGQVTAGTTGRLQYNDAGAASFEVLCSGMLGFENVRVTLTLPNQIANGADTVPISFGANDAAWSYTNDPATATSFDPSAAVLIPKDGNVFSIYIWIGASIDPDGSTPSNQYSNSLTLEAEVV